MAWFGNLRQKMMGMGGLAPMQQPMMQEPMQPEPMPMQESIQNPEPMQQPVQESIGGLGNLKQQMMAQKAIARSSGRLGGMGAPAINPPVNRGIGFGIPRPMGQPINPMMGQPQGPTFNRPMNPENRPAPPPIDVNNMRTGAITPRFGQSANRGFNPYRRQMQQQSGGMGGGSFQ